MSDIEKIILDATQYSGNSTPGIKAISASQLGSDPQQALLRYKYGVRKNKEFGQNTLGSLIHLAFEHIFSKKDNFVVEYDVRKPMYKEWIMSGSIDLFDRENKIIYDIKVSKDYTKKKILEEFDHQYIIQLSAYKYMLEYCDNISDVKTKLIFISKDAGFNARTAEETPTLEIMDIEPLEESYIHDLFVNMVDFIEAGEEQQCEDLWFRKIGGKTIPMRCEKYCDYKDVCKQYNPKPTSTMQLW
jgi:hypothetical protein